MRVGDFGERKLPLERSTLFFTAHFVDFSLLLFFFRHFTFFVFFLSRFFFDDGFEFFLLSFVDGGFGVASTIFFTEFFGSPSFFSGSGFGLLSDKNKPVVDLLSSPTREKRVILIKMGFGKRHPHIARHLVHISGSRLFKGSPSL